MVWAAPMGWVPEGGAFFFPCSGTKAEAAFELPD